MSEIFGTFIVYSLLLSAIWHSQAFITRLPCRIHANFTQISTENRKNGVLLESFQNMDKKNCGIKCVINPRCIHFDYNDVDELCRIVDSNPIDSSYTSSTSWNSYSTNFVPKKSLTMDHLSINWGVYCENHNPCLPEQLCRDVCYADKEYECINLREVASNGVALDQSLGAQGKAIDSNVINRATTPNEPACYIQIDLQGVQQIAYLQVWQTTAKRFIITVGNETDPYNNQEVTGAIDNVVGNYYTLYKFIYAKYVGLVFTSKSATRQCSLNEIKVFAI